MRIPPGFSGINHKLPSYRLCNPESNLERTMKTDVNRRSFMKIAGSTLGIGVLYTALPMPVVGEAGEMMRFLGQKNGEEMAPFSFVQLSDAQVGFNGPPDPLGTKALERAVEMITAMPAPPELVLFTGDLTHDTEEKDVHAKRMKQFQEISARMKVGKVMYVPGEHDAGLDG